MFKVQIRPFLYDSMALRVVLPLHNMKKAFASITQRMINFDAKLEDPKNDENPHFELRRKGTVNGTTKRDAMARVKTEKMTKITK